MSAAAPPPAPRAARAGRARGARRPPRDRRHALVRPHPRRQGDALGRRGRCALFRDRRLTGLRQRSAPAGGRRRFALRHGAVARRGRTRDRDARPSRGGTFGSLGARFRSAADRVPRRRRLGDGALLDSSRRDARLGRGLGSGSRPRDAALGLRGERLRGAASGAAASRSRSSASSSCARLRPRGAGRSSSESPRASRFSRRRCCSSRWRRFSRAHCSEEREERDFLEGKRAEGATIASVDERRGRERADGGGAAGRRAAARARSSRCHGLCFFHSQEFSFSGLFFEFARFGKLFGGYAGETFSYPFFTGLLRLTVLPNKGLFWYAPIVLLAPFGFFALRRRDARLALACAASAASLLLAACAWWAWDGQAGWGPRLLLPALPPLLVFAGLAPSGSARPVRFAGALALVLGAGVNLLGALVPFPAVYALSSVVPPQPISGGARGRHGVRDRARSGRRPPRDGAASPLAHARPGRRSAFTRCFSRRSCGAGRRRLSRGRVSRSSIRRSDPILPKEPAPAMLLALRPVRIGWGREYFLEGEERSVGSLGRTRCATRRSARST